MNYLQALPEDILEHLISFVDIPSIGALCQTCRASHGNISDVASREKVWLRMADLRFQLLSSKRKNGQGKKFLSNPMLYGGPTWKDAYRTMALSCRMPSLNGMPGGAKKRKHVFAKSCVSLVADDDQWQENKRYFQASFPRQHKGYFSDCLATWLMLNHTEDCNLRFTSSSTMDMSPYDCESDHDLRPGNPVPYVELQLALQNTKSGFCDIHVRVCDIEIQMFLSPDQILTQRIIPRGHLCPKLVYRNKKYATKAFSKQPCEDVISLKPFEFVILSVNLPLLPHSLHRAEMLRFETDFLSRAIAMFVPATCERTVVCGNRIGKDVQPIVNVAHFISENEIWERYMELPGNCLVLIDRHDY